MYNSKSEVEYYNKSSSSYYIALEAWRRGMSVTFIKNINNYRITSYKRSLFFCNSAMISGEYGIKAHNICKDKNRTKEILEQCDVTVPKGKLYDERTNIEEIIKYAEDIGYPVVIKPNNESNGQDVYSNIIDEKELIRIINLIFKKRKKYQIIIEQHVQGDDHRIYVVGNKISAAYKRTPATINGDGKRTIQDLIHIKNDKRRLNPHLRDRPLEIDEEVSWIIQKHGYTIDSILEKNKQIELRSKANLSVGGELKDVTNILPKEIKKMAVRACQSIPNMKNAGVDILFSDNINAKAVVLEINSMAQIASHLFPSHGESRNIASDIIDFYFPESTPKSENNVDLFYNMIPVENYLNAFSQAEYTLASAPLNPITKKKITFQQTDVSKIVKSKIRDEARRLNINGFIKVSDKKIIIVMGGDAESLGIFIEFCESLCGKQMSLDVISTKYEMSLTHGFYFIDENTIHE